MTGGRRLLIGSGIVAGAAVAVWLLLRTATDARQPVQFGLVVALALLSFWLAFEGSEWRDHPVHPNSPETRRRLPPPGREIDRLLTRQDRPRDWEDSHVTRRLRERLEPVAIDVLAHYGGLNREEARAQVADGSWTDDPVAGAFLAGREPPSGRSLWRWIHPGASTPLERVVGRTVDALLAYTEQPTTDGESAASGGFLRRLVDPERPTVGSPVHGEGGAGDGGGTTDDRREIGHWRGIGAFAAAALAAGLAFGLPGLLLGGAMAVGFAGYASIGREPTVDLDVERALSDHRPAPGDGVDVTVTVRNDGDRTLPDVRVVDGVPPAIRVSDGSPRHATVLRPGERSRFTYTVEARRGKHQFRPATVLARDLAERVEVASDAGPETRFVSEPRLQSTVPLSLRNRVAQFVGGVPTRTGGDGLEFHSVREYRRGDPLARIDWRRRARTGEFATVSLREERAANVVVVVDSRESTYRAPAGADGHACDRGVDAAVELVALLLDAGNRVGVATINPDQCWLPIRTGRGHRSQIRELLATHPSVSQAPPDGECYAVDWLDEFRARYESPAQVVFVSPLTDETASFVVRTLESYGYAVTLVSVDPTSTASSGQRFARLERLRRLYRLRTAGVRAIDWRWDETLGVALARARRRWSA